MRIIEHFDIVGTILVKKVLIQIRFIPKVYLMYIISII